MPESDSSLSRKEPLGSRTDSESSAQQHHNLQVLVQLSSARSEVLIRLGLHLCVEPEPDNPSVDSIIYEHFYRVPRTTCYRPRQRILVFTMSASGCLTVGLFGVDQNPSR